MNFVHKKHVKDKVYLHNCTPYNYKIVIAKGREKEYRENVTNIYISQIQINCNLVFIPQSTPMSSH